MAFDRYFQKVDVTANGRPVLLPKEVELIIEQGVTIFFGEDKKQYDHGTATLTSHRLLWVDEKTKHGVQLNLAHVKGIEVKSGLFSSSSKVTFHLDDLMIPDPNAPPGLKEPPLIKLPVPHPGFIKLGFAKGGRDAFKEKGLQALKAAVWKEEEETKRRKKVSSGASMGGISGILTSMKQREQQTDKTLQEAFGDLDSLMKKAAEMVSLADRFRRSQESQTMSAADKSNFQSMMINMGIESPITRDVAGAQYHSLLAGQLSDFLQQPLKHLDILSIGSSIEARFQCIRDSPIMHSTTPCLRASSQTSLKQAGGMLSLTDVYCMFNRARGTALVSPADLLTCCDLWEKANISPLRLRKFASGVLVIQSGSHNDKEASERILKLIEQKGFLTAGALSTQATVSLAVAREQLLTAEQMLYVCRDDSVEGLRFYKNIFKDYISQRERAKQG